MQEHDTFPGNVYAVTCAAGCTLTDDNGMNETVEAGKQFRFMAQAAKVYTSEPATVTRANFKSAPAKLMALGLLGGGNSAFKKLTLEEALALANLPAGGGKMRVSLPWEAQLLVSGVPAALQTAKNNGWRLTVQYREPEADNAYYNKYAACAKVSDMQAINADYQNDLTAAGEWIYPLPEMVDLLDGWSKNENIRAFLTDLPKMTASGTFPGNGSHINGCFGNCPNIEIIRCKTPNMTGAAAYGANGWVMNCPKFHTFEGDLSKFRIVQGFFYNCPSLSVFKAELSSFTGGRNTFNMTIFNKESTLRILNSLPEPTTATGANQWLGLMTIGIHVDHKTDEEVIAAIANAEAKGWTLAVQWNGTATARTASTFGLRKPPIYAKLGTLERPDGTTEQVLDWGHYVTNAEANGYIEFRSVAAAREYFGLPAEQDELLTNRVS